MLQTYELFCDHRDGRRTFRPLLCASSTDALAKVREILQTDDLIAVEVRLIGQPLFSLNRPQS